jgi:hypothetical protein
MSGFTDALKSFVSLAAPTLGTALGGPLGGMAGTYIANALGAKSAKPADLQIAMQNATPDQLLALKTADQAFAAKMEELGIERDKLVFDDIANARAREIAVKDTTPRNLAYLIITFTGLCIAATLAGWTKVDSALAGTLIGYLVAECRSTLTYYFGSSQGSRDKDATLADIAKQP